MKFEHLIEINNPNNPLIEAITREQLWRGLVLRAESPTTFLPQLDECAIGERSENSFTRSLHFGDLVVRDKVMLTPLQEVRYEVPAQGEISPSTMTMTIEAPAEGVLLVRFCYDDGHDALADAANEMYDEFRRSAYQEADIDTIRILRELAAQGKLDGQG